MLPEFSNNALNAMLRSLHEHQMMVVFIAAVIFLVVKDRLALRFSLLCLFFYITGYYSYPLIISFDQDTYIYRYIYWSACDITFMAILANWALKDKVYLWQSVLAQLVVLPAPLLQLFRLVDRHLMDLSYSTYLYKTILPLVNVITVLLCLAPLLMLIKRKCIDSHREQSRVSQ